MDGGMEGWRDGGIEGLRDGGIEGFLSEFRKYACQQPVFRSSVSGGIMEANNL